MYILNHEYCIQLLNYIAKMIIKYVNLVVIDEISPMVPQIGVKLS